MPTITQLQGAVRVDPMPDGSVVIAIQVSEQGDAFVIAFDQAGALDHIAKLQQAVKGHRPSVLQRAKPSLVVPGVRLPG